MQTRTVALLAAAVVLAGLVVFANRGRGAATEASSPTAGAARPVATATSQRTAPGSLSETSEPSGSPEPTRPVVTQTAQLDDAPGDLRDLNGALIPAGRRTADIVRLVVEARNGVLDLNLYTAEAPPRDDDPLRHEHLYGWQLDITGDGRSDWQVVVANTTHTDDANIPGWVAQATSFMNSQTRFGREFPGTVLVESTRINVRLPLDTIRAAGEIRAAGFSVDAISTDGRRNGHHDSAPDNQWPDAESWVTVKP
jgi:hypothetical protein